MPLIAVPGKHIRVILSELEIVYWPSTCMYQKVHKVPDAKNCKETFYYNIFRISFPHNGTAEIFFYQYFGL